MYQTYSSKKLRQKFIQIKLLNHSILSIDGPVKYEKALSRNVMLMLKVPYWVTTTRQVIGVHTHSMDILQSPQLVLEASYTYIASYRLQFTDKLVSNY